MAELSIIKSLDDISEFDKLELDRYMEETGCSLEDAVEHHNQLVAESDDEDDESAESIMDEIVNKYGHLSEEEEEELDRAMDEAIAEGEAEYEANKEE